ncbi:MAG TPA: ParB N-terminal domain-containing protein [Solirubrobacteraceae bacterium]|jgi:ParB/RepB/Spo0J family partition protein|nr:ParB N-terminal domain-containing protein [Solirubrobacteraceae bacterium]
MTTESRWKWAGVTRLHRVAMASSAGMPAVTTSQDPPRMASVAELGERLAALRLCEAAALEAMRRSLERHGQLTPIVVFAERDHLETLDGLKRLRAARALGWPTVAIAIADVSDVVAAKVQLLALHQRRGFTELEEAWLVRSLYRDDRLSQPEIGRLLDRHKSWVCRRLLLVEALDPGVQADVRIGLLAPRAAIALAALPRGNQTSAAAVVMRHGLTVQQTVRLVAELRERSDDAARAAWIAHRLDAAPAPLEPRPTRAPRSEADAMVTDIATLLRVGARLQARLLGTPFGALGAPATELVLDGLGALAPVLTALARTVATVIGEERAA